MSAPRPPRLNASGGGRLLLVAADQAAALLGVDQPVFALALAALFLLGRLGLRRQPRAPAGVQLPHKRVVVLRHTLRMCELQPRALGGRLSRQLPAAQERPCQLNRGDELDRLHGEDARQCPCALSLVGGERQQVAESLPVRRAQHLLPRLPGHHLAQLLQAHARQLLEGVLRQRDGHGGRRCGQAEYPGGEGGLLPRGQIVEGGARRRGERVRDAPLPSCRGEREG
eukprot:scaffold9352_cov119-Isochrysis_galbana.AAC.3